MDGANQDTDTEYDLFISYARDDKESVRELVNRLKGDGYHVWFDETELPAGGTVADQLDDAIAACRQVIICLSDFYCRKDYTRLEMQLNFTRDPANHRRRTIPVVVRPLTVPVPAAIRFIPWADLTTPPTFETEYRRMKDAILPTSRSQPRFASPDEIDALRRFADQDKALLVMIRSSREIYRFIYSKEIPGPIPGEQRDLAAKLLSCPRLPQDVLVHIRTIQHYGSLIEQELSSAAIEPGLVALRALSAWACARYQVVPIVEDPFAAFWRQLEQDRSPADVSYQLADGRRRLTPLGAVYPGRKFDDQSLADLLVVPVAVTRRQALLSEIKRCRSLGEKAPLRIVDVQRLDLKDLGEWVVVALGRPVGCSFDQLVARFDSLPLPLVIAIARQLVGVFTLLTERSPTLTASLFPSLSLVLDRSGAVNLMWNWESDSVDGEAPGESPPLQRGQFLFAALADPVASRTTVHGWELVRETVLGMFRKCPDEPAHRGWAQVTSAEKGRAFLDSIATALEDDSDIVHAAVESVLDGRDLPPWLTNPTPAQPPPPESSKPGSFQRLGKIPLDGCREAWPLDDAHIVLWEHDQTLSIRRVVDGGRVWCDSESFLTRCAAMRADGALCLGGWDGKLRWFRDGALEGSYALGWTVGDIAPLATEWLAGAWNGRLVLINDAGLVRAFETDVADGVCQIAVSGEQHFAVRSLRGGVSLFQAGRRTAQTVPIEDACDLAFAAGRFVVLAGERIVGITSTGQLRKPDRLPARGSLALLTCPPYRRCVLASERGQSWTIDDAGTYPRGPWLPRGERRIGVASSFRRFTTRVGEGGCSYWRDEKRIHTWPEALSAVLSPDGRRIVVVLPDAVEIYEDSVAVDSVARKPVKR